MTAGTSRGRPRHGDQGVADRDAARRRRRDHRAALQIEQATMVLSTLGAPEFVADVVIDVLTVLTEQRWPYEC
jgi:hypothetical protein